MKQHILQQGRIPLEVCGQRLDQVAAQLFPEFSRARLQDWIKNGDLTLAGRKVKPNTKVAGGESIALSVELLDAGDWQPEALDLRIVYEDDALLVVDKPAGLVMHPAAGNPTGTLLNGLLHHCAALKQMPRAGIVHRLDKDTTGLLVVAKTLAAQNSLVQQLQARSVSRQYVAVVVGRCPPSGQVHTAMGRDPHNRLRMAVVPHEGKEALTYFERLACLGPCSLVRLKLATGRTHQIRVHMAHIDLPLVGDPVYGRRLGHVRDVSAQAEALLHGFSRQALHAERLALIHPERQTEMVWTAAWPADLVGLVEALGGAQYVPV